MSKSTFALVTFSLFALMAISVQAIPISWTGAVSPATAPSSLVQGQFESSTDIRLIWEQQNIVLTEDLTVNLSEPGNYNRYTFNSTPAIIRAGTMVSSYLLHFDPVGITMGTLTGSVSFDTPILGVMVQDPTLNASTPVVGVNGTTYPAYSPLSGADTLSLTLTMDTVSVLLCSDYHVDHVRIITQVPDAASTGFLVSCALFGLGGVRWLIRRRRI